MSKVFRHDAITLRESVRPEDFTKFMTEELVPYFSTRFKGPTRASRADIKHQTVLADGKIFVLINNGNNLLMLKATADDRVEDRKSVV